ncbi:MAG: 2TM domain-containing protein [Flavobacteriaceae bacterium]|nr:2TM domain-containing protein [Flavobacteriaceae bacterium]
MEENYIENQSYLRAKKRVDEIKGFYSHLVVMIFVLPFLVFINLQLTPQYHWFWWAIIGNAIGLFIHWFTVFGKNLFGFGEDWEKRKIQEYINKKL